jgi:hypothetical protein
VALGCLMGFAIECPVKKSQNNQIKRGKQKDYTGNNESRKHSSVPLDGYGIKRVQVPELIEREFDFPSLSLIERIENRDGNNHQVESAFAICQQPEFNEPDGREKMNKTIGNVFVIS